MYVQSVWCSQITVELRQLMNRRLQDLNNSIAQSQLDHQMVIKPLG